MRMAMAGNRKGTERIETDEVHKDFMVAPLDMAMRMHMAGLIYAPSDAATLMAMAHWMDNSMNLVTRANEVADASSSGVGDIGVSALIGIKNAGSVRAHLNAGVSIPVGSIEEMGVTPMSMGEEVQLPYPMQVGSGSWDLTPGLTVLAMTGRTSWGVQGKAKLRLNENSRGYRRGHELETTAWFALRASEGAGHPGDNDGYLARCLAARGVPAFDGQGQEPHVFDSDGAFSEPGGTRLRQHELPLRVSC